MAEKPRSPKPGRAGARLCCPDRPTLEACREVAAGCKACDLYKRATQTVFGEGPKRARMMLVGEQPGDAEDLAGHPFVGPAGKLLDRALGTGGHRSQHRLRHQRRQALQVGAARQAAHPREAERRRNRRVPSLARDGNCARAAARAGVPGRDGGAGIARKERSRSRNSAGEFVESSLAPLVIATVHPSSILRAPRRRGAASRRWSGSWPT